MTKRKQSLLLIAIGLLLIAAALCVVLYNIYQSKSAGAGAEKTAELLIETITETVAQTAESADEPTDELEISPENDAVLPVDEETETSVEIETERPEVVKPGVTNRREIPTAEVDNIDYMGVLELTELGITLPVISSWSYPNLRIAPCRYSGSPDGGGFVISAHNYSTFFGRIGGLSVGSEISFTDMYGTTYRYTVALIETLEANDSSGMLSGDWALTLFTCTVGGKSRVTVRCNAVTDD